MLVVETLYLPELRTVLSQTLLTCLASGFLFERTSTARPTGGSDWMNSSCSDPATAKCPWSLNPLVLVSMDGFSAQYLLRGVTPAIEKLRQCGVYTPYMRPVYPTLTFPNHYSIITGLYPESHGIVGNIMYDPELNKTFTYSSSEKYNSSWWGGEPLWITAQKQGRRTATYYWPGSDVNISGYRPDIWVKYDSRLTFHDQVDTLFQWLTKPEGERPDFITLYFNEPDEAGHKYGPDSPEVGSELRKLDEIVHSIMNGLLQRNLESCVNLILLSDHGMANATCEKQITLNTYLGDVNNFLIYYGSNGYIHTKYRTNHNRVCKNENPTSTETVLKSLECKSPHMNVFSKENAPVRHHYSNNRRIGDVILDVDESWLVNPKKYSRCLEGEHGYDNTYTNMHAIFLAHGPDFKSDLFIRPFENIELYNMMADLLRIKPAPNNGTAGSLSHLLRNPPPLQDRSHLQQIQACSSTGRCNAPANLTIQLGTETFPFGVPMSEHPEDLCVLKERDSHSVYSCVYNTSLVTSLQLRSDQTPIFSDFVDYVSSGPRVGAGGGFPTMTEDPVLEANQTSANATVHILFKEGAFVLRLMNEYATKYKHLHTYAGPAYDYNFDGLADNHLGPDTRYTDGEKSIPNPTHFYFIFMKCSDGSDLSICPEDKLDILSFILPNQNHTSNCLTHRDFLLKHVARIRDIELLTGLRFLTNLPDFESARLRTYLPTQLWDSVLSSPWSERPCRNEKATCPNARFPLLLISLDGFRADYLKRNLTPAIQRLADCGVHTPYMRAVYPTVTFPNHYTIVTGLYPESHGIVYNSMYDEDIGQIFSIGSRTESDPRWWKGEPIWVTAQKQGLKAATYFWPGSSVNISGIYPDIWKQYDGKVGYTERLYDVLNWITMPGDQRPDFITLYFDQPDHAGHDSGPDSEEVNGQLETVDKLIDILMSNLYDMGIHDCMNIIIVADHGMSSESCNRTVVLEDFYANITHMLTFDRVLGRIFLEFQKDNRYHAHRLQHPYSADEVVKELMCKTENMKIFTTATLPVRHHYTVSPRIGDILLDMKDEWLVLSHRTSFCNGGNHGWDNIYKHMHALFLAHGPAFKANFTAEPFENIELYNLMSDILGIEPAPNNGTRGSLNYMLRNDNMPEKGQSSNNTQPIKMCNIGADSLSSCGCSKIDASGVFLTKDDTVFPYGVPSVTSGELLCLFHLHGFSVGLSRATRGPAFLSLTMHQNMEYSASQTDEMCIIPLVDESLPSFNCSRGTTNSDIKLYPLLSIGTNVIDGAFLSSTLVPMYTGFFKNVWRFIQDTLLRVPVGYSANVIVGPAYDYNHDSLQEGVTNETLFADANHSVPIPTHIYMIFMQCKEKGDTLPCMNDVMSTAHILPNLKEIPNCLTTEQFILDNVARIRDVELLTGLRFLTSLDTETAARLKTKLREPDFGNKKRK